MSPDDPKLAIDASQERSIAEVKPCTNGSPPRRQPTRRQRAIIPLLAATAVCCLHTPLSVSASAFVPMPVEDLAVSSVASVLGQVTDVAGHRNAEGELVTRVRVHVDEVIAGRVPFAAITLEERGGRVGDERLRVHGAPEFVAGERLILFLETTGDGTLRTNHGALGKLSVELDSHGMPQASRSFPRGSLVVSDTLVEHGGGYTPLQEVLGRIRSVKPAVASAPDPAAEPPDAPPWDWTGAAAFSLDGPARFFEPDENLPLDFLVDGRGDPTLGLDASLTALRDALDRWTLIPSASLQMREDALTDDLSTLCPGPNKIRFDDPDRVMSDPVGCRGVLALGATRSTAVEAKVFGGTEFERARCGFITFANGWADCPEVWNTCNLAEIATHELGHVFGLGHSSNRMDEADAALRDATMYFRAHFDGRCADVRRDDIDGVSFLYPTARPPTITTPRTLPPGSPLAPYRQTLQAEGGAGNFTWATVQGDFPGLTLSDDGILSGTPSTNGNTFLRIRATDADGDSHTKLFLITVGTPGPVPPTPSATPTQTLLPTPTPPAAPSCPGDCDASGTVTVDELLILVRIVLGELTSLSCAAGDRNGDDVIAVDDLLAAVSAAVNGCPGPSPAAARG
jgi:hypothetical protein